ncbi:MAG: hypothetical protein U9R69_00040, partial [Thermodesulfobacteriota bacterium]|nr:hypothetical protein [Thermodesulfobacteriota bacterium]
ETCELLFDVRCIDFFSRVTSSGNSAITCGGSEVKKTTGCGVRLRLSEQFARKLTRNFYVMNDEEVGVFHIDKILTLLLDTVIGLTIADRFPMEWGYEVQCQEPVRNISADRNSSLFYQLIKTADNDQLLIEFDNFT